MEFQEYVQDFRKSMPATFWGRYVSVQFSDLIPRRVAGMANGMHNDDIVFIWVNYDAWRQMDKSQRAWLIWHELAHDVYNVRHNETDIMSGSVPMRVTPGQLEAAKEKLITLINGKR
jgi:hypothetical protein